MDNREKEILEQIDAKTEDIKVPEGLTPELMEQRLNRREKPKHKIKKYWVAGVAAACLVLAVSGGILISSLNRNQDKINQGGSTLNDMLATADDYDQIYQYLQNSQSDENEASFGLWSSESSTATTEDADISSSTATAESEAAYDTGGSGTADYSDTNVREEGVGEADYVKTDGSYLYVRKENMTEVEIIDTRAAEMKVVGTISLSEELEIAEFYIQNSKIMILCRETTSTSDGASYGLLYNNTNTTQVVTYDISNPEQPEKLGKLSQSGSYYSSRFVDGYLYVFSQFTPNAACAQDDIPEYIPFVDGDAVAESQILIPAGKQGSQYMVITSIALDQPDQIIDSKAVFTSSGQCYVSGENIYIYEYQWKYMLEDEWKESYNSLTAIRKISYQDGKLEAIAQNTIPGYLDSSFCIDEYDGYLRAVTTVQTDTSTTNSVYVMNEDLKTVGKIEGLAEDETIYSARFMGETAYFVTYEQVDPLFSADLSDPENPKIIGKLKIPGFSEYLHVYDDNLLLGIGMEVDEDTQVTDGVKISMFDISDPTDVKEINKYIIEGSYSSDSFYDYKAVVIDADKNIIGFTAYGAKETYYVFSYDDEEGFTCMMEEDVNGSSISVTRGLYIGETLYVVKGNVVESYSLKTYKKIDDLIL